MLQRRSPTAPALRQHVVPPSLRRRHTSRLRYTDRGMTMRVLTTPNRQHQDTTQCHFCNIGVMKPFKHLNPLRHSESRRHNVTTLVVVHARASTICQRPTPHVRPHQLHQWSSGPVPVTFDAAVNMPMRRRRCLYAASSRRRSAMSTPPLTLSSPTNTTSAMLSTLPVHESTAQELTARVK